jgi:hypothetical protein
LNADPALSRGLRVARPEDCGGNTVAAVQCAASSLTSGGILELSGAYDFGTTTVALLDNTWVMGVRGSTVITMHAPWAMAFSSTAKSSIKISDLSVSGGGIWAIHGGSDFLVDNVTVNGGGAGQGIWSYGTFDLVVRDSKFLDINDAVYLDSNPPASAKGTPTLRAKITGCHFEQQNHYGWNYPVGVYAYFANGTIVSSSTFKDIIPGGSVAGAMGYGVYEGDGAADSVQISGCRFEGSGLMTGVLTSQSQTAIVDDCVFQGPFRGVAYGAKDFTVAHSTFDKAWLAASCAGASCDSVKILGNSFKDVSGEAALVVGAGTPVIANAIVANNQFKGCQYGAIWLRFAGYSEVTDNVITDCNTSNDTSDWYRGGINFYGCINGWVDGNKIENTAAGGGNMQYGVAIAPSAANHSINVSANNRIIGTTVGSVKNPLTAPPTLGTWAQGSRIHNWNVAAGGSPGWVCVAGGAPGTWKAEAPLAN